jgi:hypothetical protein
VTCREELSSGRLGQRYRAAAKGRPNSGGVVPFDSGSCWAATRGWTSFDGDKFDSKMAMLCIAARWRKVEVELGGVNY